MARPVMNHREAVQHIEALERRVNRLERLFLRSPSTAPAGRRRSRSPVQPGSSMKPDSAAQRSSSVKPEPADDGGSGAGTGAAWSAASSHSGSGAGTGGRRRRRGDTEELTTKIVCRGCPRPLLYKFHAPFCCGACATWCAGSQADRHGAQRRHGRDCSWGALRVDVWRTAGQNHAHLADGG